MVVLRTVGRCCPRLPVRVTVQCRPQLPAQIAALRCSGSFVSLRDGRCFSSPAHIKKTPGPENSYISLGQFDGMDGNEAQQTMGIAYLEQALELQQAEHNKLNSESPKWIGSCFNLAQLHLNLGKQHHQTGDMGPAASHYQQAVHLLDPILPELPENAEQHKKAAQFMLSQAYSGLSLFDANEHGEDKEKKDEALIQLQKALKLRRQTFGKQHASVAECLNNIAAIHFSRGSYSRAAENYEEALTILTKEFGGEENKFSALTLYNLGLCWVKMGYREAEAALQKALTIAEVVFGPKHEQTDLIRETLVSGRAAQMAAAADRGAPKPSAE